MTKALISLLLLGGGPLFAQSGTGSARGVELTVTSGDGLRLEFGVRGTIRALAAGSLVLGLRDEPGGFFVTDVAALLVPVAGETNRAPDPSFELDGDGDLFPDGWVFGDYWGSGGTATWDGSVAHDGNYSVRIDGTGGEAILSQSVSVHGGERLIAQAFRRGDGSLRILAFWFDAYGAACGTTLGRWNDPVVAFAPCGEIVVAPADAAQVRFGLQVSGGPTTYLDSARLATPDRSVHLRLDGPLEPGPAGILQVTLAREIGVRAEVTWHGAAAGILGRLSLQDLEGEERSLDLSLVLPLESDRRLFHGDARQAVSMTRLNQWGEFQSYANYLQWGLPFGGGAVSIYPLAAVGEPVSGGGVALGVPPQAAGPFTVGYETAPGGGLVLRWPVGLSRHLTAQGADGGSGTREFVLTRGDEPWGLRRALQAQARLYPGYGERRFGQGGLWLPFTSPATIPNVGDFRFAVHEGDGSVSQDDQLGILSFVYIEPWDYWLDLGDFNRQPSYEEAVARLRDVASGQGGWPGLWVDLARATLVGGHLGADGRFLNHIGQAPWISGSGWSFLVSHNPEPGLVDPGVRGWSAPYDVQLGLVEQAYQRASDSGAVLDGTYLDSMVTYFGSDLDRRVRQWEAIDTPLTYDARTLEPALWPPAQVVAVARAHAERERAAGRMVMGNAIAGWSRPAAVYLDYMGIEANWGGGPESDASLLARRVAAYRKPYCILQNTDFSSFDHVAMERYMSRCLFYGIYASCFSQDASSNPYWEDPTLYERDRDLFVRYVQLVQELDAAGWEPVTDAQTDMASVHVERFGTLPPSLFFTVLNDTAQGVTITLTIHKAPLGLGHVTVVTERITGSSLSFTQDAEFVWVTDQLQAGQARLVQVD